MSWKATARAVCDTVGDARSPCLAMSARSGSRKPLIASRARTWTAARVRPSPAGHAGSLAGRASPRRVSCRAF
eukprot:2318655-Lingulodinium_polyedra.AAC.1